MAGDVVELDNDAFVAAAEQKKIVCDEDILTLIKNRDRKIPMRWRVGSGALQKTQDRCKSCTLPMFVVDGARADGASRESDPDLLSSEFFLSHL